MSVSVPSEVRRRTPLHDVHLAEGAMLTEFAGWSMPLRYGSEIAEHTAVRTTAGLFDLSHMGEIELVGPDAAAALDRALVSDIGAVAVGKAKYTMICDADGGIVDDLIVYRLGEYRYLVVANASNAAAVASALQERARGFAVEVRDRCEAWALLAVQGPAAVATMAGCTDIDLSTVRYYSSTPAEVAGCKTLLARTGYTGEDGFEIFCEPDDARTIWEALRRAGREHGVVPAGLACRDTLRLEAGMPLYGHELSADLTPYEAGLGRVVALEKPVDFVGRAALAVAAARPVTHRRVGLVPDGRRAPRAGYAVLSPTDGGVVGVVTSGAPSPTLGHPVAMAYLDIAHSDPGSSVEVDVRGRAEPARVTELPFYRRSG